MFSLTVRDHFMIAHSFRGAVFGPAQALHGATYVVDLEVRNEADEVQMVTIGVDAIGRTEDLLLRPLSPLVATLGPFAGAIVRGDGSLHLAIDVDALAPRVRNLASGARP